MTNGLCFIRDQPCKCEYNCRDECFIACPSSDEIKFELDVIEKILNINKIKPYLAVREREYSKDIFCQKICSKIVESKFCIAILNDVKPEGKEYPIPNSNVFFEYGLMTALNKKIIPIKEMSQSLAFNIRGLDIIKYDKKSFQNDIEDAIKAMVKLIQIEHTSIIDTDKATALFLNKFDREIKENYKIAYQMKRSINGMIFFDPTWQYVTEQVREFSFVYYELFMREYLNKIFGEEEKIIVNSYNMLKRLQEKASDSYKQFKDNGGRHDLFDNQLLGGQFNTATNLLCEELEHALIILNKDNEAYIKSIKN